jgi:DNA-binding MarR family transcriptional regulator
MKKPLVSVIEAWIEFEQHYPGGDDEAFYRYMSQLSGQSPRMDEARDHQIGRLARVIGRLSSVYGLYHRAAMKNAGLPAQDSFFYLNVLNQLGEVNKSELINYLLVETTTGMAAISKLKRAGLVSERQDPNDRRAKLIRITDKGSSKLKTSMSNAKKVNEMVFRDLDRDALSLCLQILEPVEEFHTKESVAIRQLPFKEMAERILKHKRGTSE